MEEICLATGFPIISHLPSWRGSTPTKKRSTFHSFILFALIQYTYLSCPSSLSLSLSLSPSPRFCVSQFISAGTEAESITWIVKGRKGDQNSFLWRNPSSRCEPWDCREDSCFWFFVLNLIAVLLLRSLGRQSADVSPSFILFFCMFWRFFKSSEFGNVHRPSWGRAVA